jgi:transcriptional regulator with XRE-family HTH domain
MNLGKLMEAYRKQEKLTLRAFAKQTGIDHVTLWRLEQGRHETCKQWPAILRWVFGK